MDKVLLIEDDASIAETLVINLKVNGYEVTHALTLKDARGALSQSRFQIILLDINLPDGNGFDFCAEIRNGNAEIPVLMLTAKTDEASAVKGIELGATDYIRKPFGTNELLARMKRLTNRDVYSSSKLSYGDLSINLTDRRVLFDGKELGLTRREFDILAVLTRRAGNLVAKENVLAAIDQEGNIFDGTLASHISNLRGKLQKATQGRLQIIALYGQGYRLEKK